MPAHPAAPPSASGTRCSRASRWSALGPAIARPGAAGFLQALCSRPILGVYFDVVERKIAGPDRRGCLAAMEHGPYRELRLLHRRHALLFAVSRVAATLMGDPHLVDVEIHPSGVEAAHSRAADRGEDAPEVGIGGEESSFPQRRML